MKHRHRILSIICLLTISCSPKRNIYEQSFIHSIYVPTTIQFKSNDERTPSLIESDDPDLDLKIFREQGAVIIGSSFFESIMRSSDKAVDFAKKINATDVIYSRKYMGKRYKNINTATQNSNNPSMLRLPDWHPDQRRFDKENYYQYRVDYLYQEDKI